MPLLTANYIRYQQRSDHYTNCMKREREKRRGGGLGGMDRILVEEGEGGSRSLCLHLFPPCHSIHVPCTSPDVVLLLKCLSIFQSLTTGHKIYHYSSSPLYRPDACPVYMYMSMQAFSFTYRFVCTCRVGGAPVA